MKLVRHVSAAFLLLLFVAVVSAPGQDKKEESKLRTVRGAVTDKDNTPLPESNVFLKNTRTQTVRTNRTDEGGRYRFSGLDPNVDYEIYAEYGEQTSRSHTISSFDSRKDIVLDLKVDKKRGK